MRTGVALRCTRVPATPTSRALRLRLLARPHAVGRRSRRAICGHARRRSRARRRVTAAASADDETVPSAGRRPPPPKEQRRRRTDRDVDGRPGRPARGRRPGARRGRVDPRPPRRPRPATAPAGAPPRQRTAARERTGGVPPPPAPIVRPPAQPAAYASTVVQITTSGRAAPGPRRRQRDPRGRRHRSRCIERDRRPWATRRTACSTSSGRSTTPAAGDRRPSPRRHATSRRRRGARAGHRRRRGGPTPHATPRQPPRRTPRRPRPQPGRAPPRSDLDRRALARARRGSASAAPRSASPPSSRPRPKQRRAAAQAAAEAAAQAAAEEAAQALAEPQSTPTPTPTTEPTPTPAATSTPHADHDRGSHGNADGHDPRQTPTAAPTETPTTVPTPTPTTGGASGRHRLRPPPSSASPTSCGARRPRARGTAPALTSAAWAAGRQEPARTTRSPSTTPVHPELTAAQLHVPGDLVFWGDDEQRRPRSTTSRIYLGDGRIIHAPRTGRPGHARSRCTTGGPRTSSAVPPSVGPIGGTRIGVSRDVLVVPAPGSPTRTSLDIQPRERSRTQAGRTLVASFAASSAGSSVPSRMRRVAQAEVSIPDRSSITARSRA